MGTWQSTICQEIFLSCPCYHLCPYKYEGQHGELPGFGCHSRSQHKLTTIVYQNACRLGMCLHLTSPLKVIEKFIKLQMNEGPWGITWVQN